MTEKVGKLAKKYCYKESYDGRVYYDCAGAIRNKMTDQELDELGFDRNWNKHKDKSELVDYKKCNATWNYFDGKCGDGKTAIYHGTSRKNAENILKKGFKPAPAYLGTGVYFQKAWTIFGQGLNANSAIRYARDNEHGSIVAGCLPDKYVKGYRDMYTREDEDDYDSPWITPDWYDDFNEAQSESPERIELFFAWKGHKYNTLAGLKHGFTAAGNKVRNIALMNDLHAWKDDGGQVVVYNPNLLRQMKFMELKACRTEPKKD